MAQQRLAVAHARVSEHEMEQALEQLEAVQRAEREQFGIGMGRIGGESATPFQEQKPPIDVMHRTVPVLAPAEPVLELPDLPPEPKPIELPQGWEFKRFNGETYVHVPGEKGSSIPYRDVVAGHFSLTPRPMKKPGFFKRIFGR